MIIKEYVEGVSPAPAMVTTSFCLRRRLPWVRPTRGGGEPPMLMLGEEEEGGECIAGSTLRDPMLKEIRSGQSLNFFRVGKGTQSKSAVAFLSVFSFLFS